MPEAFNFTNIEGSRGEIWVPSLAILVARLERPQLMKRPPGVDTPTVGQYDLQAAFSYLQKALYLDEDFTKLYLVFIGKKALQVTPNETSKIEVLERHLRVEGVDLSWHHPE